MSLTTETLKKLVANWASIMQQQKEKLIDLDAVVGDSDLGLTMSDGFTAAYEEVKDSDETDIGKFFYQAGKRMSTAVPSTMGTLMASGLMQIGKVFKGRTKMEQNDFAEFFIAYFDGVQNRGKAKVGDKTFLDGLFPAINALKQSIAENKPWSEQAQSALEAAKSGVEQTKTMLAVHGRMATRGENSRALLDPGAYVAMLLIEGYLQFVNDNS